MKLALPCWFLMLKHPFQVALLLGLLQQHFGAETTDDISQTCDIYHPHDVHELDRSMQSLTVWPYDLRSYYPKVRKLDLSANQLTKVPDDAFKCMPNLAVLLLNGNKIDTFPKQPVAALDRLLELDLSHNSIINIPDGALANNKQLSQLRLNYNQIDVLPALMTWLPQDGKLDHLEVSNNLISQFGGQDDQLCPFQNPGGNLDLLDLSYSMLERLPACVGDSKYMKDMDNLILEGNDNWYCRVLICGGCPCSCPGEPDGGPHVVIETDWCKLPLCKDVNASASEGVHAGDVVV